MSVLAAEHSAINLGQGFPDEDGPLAIREAAAKSLREGPNQYAPSPGLPMLRQSVAAHARRFYDLAFDPDSEVLITSGATEALADCLIGLTAPGDEAVLFEPAYDSYRPVLETVGVKVKAVRLAPPRFALDEAALAAVFSPRTALVLINSPLNPAGRVFSREELEMIATFAKRHDSYVVCDEVYEHLVFDGLAHVPMITLPGMRERCIRIGSAGKMFSLTGWKVGWVSGPARLVAAVAKAHQYVTFTTSPALQIGVAHGLNHEMDFTLNLTRSLQARRDRLAAALQSAGFEVTKPQGTYFLSAGIGNLTNESDRSFCERLTREAGIAAIPLSAFYKEDAPVDMVRFAFCKTDAVLEDVARRLAGHFAMLERP